MSYKTLRIKKSQAKSDSIMAVSKDIEKNHIKGFKREIAKQKNRNDFFTWFTSSKNADSALVQGHWDFSLHIAYPLAIFLKNPEEKIVLEIGHGGGRMLLSAAQHFNTAIGIDIHDSNAIVEDDLKIRGVHNFKLIKTDGKNIPLDENSVDLVYSFIVLQHVEKIEIFENYFKEAYRILKPNGLAILYFGRYYKFSINRASKFLYLLDNFLELIKLKGRYLELPARINEINLKVSLIYAKKIAKKFGFEVCKTLVSHKKVPNGMRLYGGQHGLILQKPH